MTFKAAVIGHPVAHSKSPKIHQHWMKKYGIEGTYNAVDIEPNVLEQRITRLADEGYTGFNATIPHKEALSELCDELDEAAQKIGAVNTVKIEDGRFYGSNSDAFGFIENLKKSQGGFKFQGRAVILGAGGAARAAIYGLKESGLNNITICNRTRDRAEALAAEFECDVMDWDVKNFDEASLLVNATSLGMSGKEPLNVDLMQLPREAIVYDIVYAPLLTDLLIAAQDYGNPVVTGIGMLLYQAQLSFKIWTGIMPEVTPELEQLVLA